MKTPRTDAALVPYSSLNSFSEVVPAAFAQGLEAELAKLARLDWRPVAAGLPSEEDADEVGDVEWSDGHDIWQAGWARSPHQPTHWRPISLPPLITP
jgi:hypothetical protein